MLQPSTIRFLKELTKNNNKPWIDEHRNNYLDAKADFEKLVAVVIKETATFDSDVSELQVKNCTYRQNRDVRFSKDKRPYKNNMGAYIAREGKKSMYAGYYFHFEPGGKSFTGGGLWMPEAPNLKKVRQEIDYCFTEFSKIIKNKDFKKEYGDLEQTSDIKLINLPRGYEKENPAVEYLKLKSLLALKPITDKELMEEDLAKKIIRSFKALMPLVKFINRSPE